VYGEINMEEKKCPECGGKMEAYNHFDPDICENVPVYVCKSCEAKQEERNKRGMEKYEAWRDAGEKWWCDESNQDVW